MTCRPPETGGGCISRAERMHVDLKKRWTDLCRRVAPHADAEACDACYQTLVHSYATPPRAYHNLDHIAFCLDQFDVLRTECLEPDIVELAVWFHDAIYDSRAKDNEERSAALAQQCLEPFRLPPRTLTLVAKLIDATKHVRPPGNSDAAALVDADLAILGQPEPVFDTYERAIGAEYDWMTDEAFARGRAEFIRRFLARDRIFHSRPFMARYEAIARANLERSLTRLGTSPAQPDR
jgi:predicted metal-dependent HD superfamily phosphohydrolase